MIHVVFKSFRTEVIPDSPLGANHLRMRGIGFDLVPEPADMNVQRFLVTTEFCSPYLEDQGISREDLTGPGSKLLQKLIFLYGEVDLPVVYRRRPAVLIQSQSASHDDAVGLGTVPVILPVTLQYLADANL